ncbi:MAG: radical SAM protein [Myxococcales bacterium]|nr:radical SAM protein [Myxococcales bacterium]
MLQTLEAKVQAAERISRDEAAWLFHHAADADLRRLSASVRGRFHRPDEASYLIMAIVNYTNVCVARCDYCSFYRLPKHPEGYRLSFDEVARRIDKLIALGGTLVGFNGGFHPELRLRDYAELFERIHARYPKLAFKEMTVAEFMYACKVSRLSYREGARMMADAGTQWLTGGGAEVLDEAFRKRHSPGKGSVESFYEAQAAILEAGIGSTATMVIGFDESLDERLNHLERLRRFQDDAGGIEGQGLASFLCWTYKAYGSELGGEEIEARQYLRWLAISRIYLDNIVHIRTSVLTKNEEAMLGLQYGANDFDLPTEDEVTQKAGATISHDFARLLDAAEHAGFRPVHRHAFPKHPVPGATYEPTGKSREQVLSPSRALGARALPVTA